MFDVAVQNIAPVAHGGGVLNFRLKKPVREGNFMEILTHSPVLRGGSQLLERVRGVVLLSGSIRAKGLAGKIGRSVLDLPIDGDRTLAREWQDQVQDLACGIGAQLPLRVLIDQLSSRPASFRSDGWVKASVERDQLELRGTGGVLRDISVEFDPADYLLVCNGGQIPREPLSEISQVLSDCGGDINIIGHQDGTPSGFMLIRCGCLQHLPKQGFIDLKEQALTALSERYSVEVATRKSPTAWPVRTLTDYIKALRQLQGQRAGACGGSAFEEDWQASFSLVEKTGTCAAGARIHDAVVLGGGEVKAGAVVVRSVICSGAVVRRGEMVVDEVRTMSSK